LGRFDGRPVRRMTGAARDGPGLRPGCLASSAVLLVGRPPMRQMSRTLRLRHRFLKDKVAKEGRDDRFLQSSGLPLVYGPKAFLFRLHTGASQLVERPTDDLASLTIQTVLVKAHHLSRLPFGGQFSHCLVEPTS
jgi:hypothetical protein